MKTVVTENSVITLVIMEKSVISKELFHYDMRVQHMIQKPQMSSTVRKSLVQK
jgi:hypothetical protein